MRPRTGRLASGVGAEGRLREAAPQTAEHAPAVTVLASLVSLSAGPASRGLDVLSGRYRSQNLTHLSRLWPLKTSSEAAPQTAEHAPAVTVLASLVSLSAGPASRGLDVLSGRYRSKNLTHLSRFWPLKTSSEAAPQTAEHAPAVTVLASLGPAALRRSPGMARSGMQSGGGQRHELAPGLAQSLGDLPFVQSAQRLGHTILCLQEALRDLEAVLRPAVSEKHDAVRLGVVLGCELDVREMRPEIRLDAGEDLCAGVAIMGDSTFRIPTGPASIASLAGYATLTP